MARWMKMESSKWIATVASIWIQSSAGSSYAFGIYSTILKSSQGYDQSTLDTVSVFKDIGANAGIFSGLLYAAVAPRDRGRSVLRGPWIVHAAGAALCIMGYFFIWLAVSGVIHRPPVPTVCLAMLLAAQAQTFFNTANVVTSVQNFPDYSGTIVGIMKGFLGLGGAILVQAYQALFKGNPSNFLLMLALLPTLLTLLLMCSVRIYPNNNGDDKRHLNNFSLVSLIITAYLMISIILENIFTLPDWTSITLLVVLILLLFSPFGIAINAQREDSCRSSQVSSTVRTSLITAPQSLEPEKFSRADDLVEYHEVPTDEDENNSSKNHILQDGEEMNLLQAMRTMNFWLLFVAMISGMGSGLATINNISQIGESLKYTTVEINTLVSLWSIWNFLGRFGAGYVSDIFLHKRGWARPLFMTLTLAAMGVGHAIIASGFFGNLYVGSILVGVCYGSQWSLMPTITSEIFGVLHMGTIFNTISIASPVGSYILSVRVIGYIYDKEASGQENSCSGTKCFMLSFFILAAVSFFGFLVSLILYLRTRRFYTMVLLRRLRHSSRQ